MRIVPVECLRDNYAYLVIDEETGRAAVVDPSEDRPVRRALDREGLELEAIWLTHHHWDHVGGVEALCDALSPARVLGSAHDMEHGRIPRQTHGLTEGDAFEFAGQQVRILHIPGHTLGAIAYHVGEHVFTGDTLFLGGCGRVFEGTMDMMSQSLDKLRRLPERTRVWCGHEYTVKNLKFAATVEPESEAVAAALKDAERRRAAGEPTVPGSLAQERAVNPFLRYDAPEVARGDSPVEAFTRLREAKDRF
ncbi:MAG: hydroxyacylglutathione hydrolase [Myxococcota bacterium]